MRKSHILLGAVLGAVLLAGCLFEGDGNHGKPVPARLEVKAVGPTSSLAKRAVDSSGPLVITDSSGLQFSIEEARAVVRKIKGEGSATKCPVVADTVPGKDKEEDEDECGDEREFKIKGPFTADLLTGALTPALGTIMVPEGVYTKLEVKLGIDDDDDDTPSASAESSLVIKGTLLDTGSASRPFTLALDFDEEIEVKNDSGLVLQDSVINNMLVSLKVDQWLANLNLKPCLQQVDPTGTAPVIITKSSPLGQCLDIENTIKAAARGSFEVEEDDE